MIPHELSLFRDKINKLVPLNTLNQKNFNVLMESVEIVKLAKGQLLFSENTIDNRHYYLLQGSLYIRSQKGENRTQEATSAESLRPVAHAQPRRSSATAHSDALCLAVDSRSLEMMVNWAQSGEYEVNEVSPENSADSGDWMERLLSNGAFQQIPPRNLQNLFAKLERFNASSGEIICEQGQPGDYFYVITEGSAQVLRHTPNNSSTMVMAELGPGDSFGEDALFSSMPRSATVKMTSDGRLVQLSREDFKKLIANPLMQSVDYPEATKQIKQRTASWLDVRLPSEHKKFHFDQSLNLPLFYLRLKINSLDPEQNYILYCDSGERSAAGVYVMKKQGLNATLLEGGLNHSMQKANPDLAEAALQ